MEAHNNEMLASIKNEMLRPARKTGNFGGNLDSVPTSAANSRRTTPKQTPVFTAQETRFNFLTSSGRSRSDKKRLAGQEETSDSGSSHDIGELASSLEEEDGEDGLEKSTQTYFSE